MNVSEALRRINFKIGTLDDITGRAINNIIETRYIIDELNTQLRAYANTTKGIQAIYSVPLNTKTPVVPAPPLALRSESIFFAEVINNQKIYPLDIRGVNEVLNNFTINPFVGITSWAMPFMDGNIKYLGLYPINSTSANVTALNGDILFSDTTITVDSTAGFLNNFGRIKIGEETILYQYKDDTKFYNCIRGIEGTIPVNHSDNDVVSHCNLIIYYSRLPVKIEVTDDNFVSQETLAREIEVVEEHLEGIIKIVAYNLILKLDKDRAGQYKVDAQELFEQYTSDIRKGYQKIRKGANLREPYISQSGYPAYTNLQV